MNDKFALMPPFPLKAGVVLALMLSMTSCTALQTAVNPYATSEERRVEAVQLCASLGATYRLLATHPKDLNEEEITIVEGVQRRSDHLCEQAFAGVDIYGAGIATLAADVAAMSGLTVEFLRP